MAPPAAARSDAASPAPLEDLSRSRTRERAQTAAAALLSKMPRALWYAESLVLSARFLQFVESASWARGSVRCGDRISLWERAAEPRLRRSRTTVLEFGVAEGYSTRWWTARAVPFAAWHGFDTFEGLPADWTRGEVPVVSAGVFRPEGGAGAVPDVEASFPVEWHRGLIEATLPPFDRPDTGLFVIVDVDLLSPTSVILDWLKRHGRRGDLVYFDEAFDPWNEGLGIRRAVAAGLEMRAVAHTGTSLLVSLAG